MKKAHFLILASILLTGCVTRPISYYYGNHEVAYYHSKKDGTPASIAKYQKSLEDIIQTSERKGMRVPPGIYCEYGYILAKQGNAKADSYFDLEVRTYPESAKFILLLRNQLKQQAQQS